MQYRALFPLVGVLLVAACKADPTAIDGSLSAANSPSAARTASNPPRANLVWADSIDVAAPGEPANWQPALITGDGRVKTGAPGSATLSNEYQGNYCGVAATVDSGLNADPNTNYSSTMYDACGSARVYRFYFAGRGAAPLEFGPHHWVTEIGGMTVGASASKSTMYGIQQTNCQRVYFDNLYPPANHVRVTRLPDVTGANGLPVRQWHVASQGSHRGMCTVTGKGGKILSTGVSYYLPFAYTVTEVPAPYPTYP